MEYIYDKDKKYLDEILKHLREYNFSKTGPRKVDDCSLYIVEKETVIAGMKIHLSWDWVSIRDLKYNNIEELKAIISKLCLAYRNDCVGIRLNTKFKHIVSDFIKLGFVKKKSIKYSPLMNDLYYLELIDLESQIIEDYEVKITKEENKEIELLLSSETKRLNRLYNVQESTDEICVIALDGDIFCGGVLGILYNDHMYVDLLVVNKLYRGKNIGSNLMNKLEMSLPKSIKTISLGTVEFQAKGFYEKLGYKSIMTQKDFPKGFMCYTLVKEV